MRYLLILLIFLPGCSALQPNTSYATTDKVLYASMVGCQAWDYSSTTRGLDAGAKELNPILGENPSDGQILALKGAVVVVSTLIANKTEGMVRKSVLGIGAIAGCGAAIHNENQF